MPAKILFMFTVICCTAVPFGCKQAGTEHTEHIVQTIPSIPAPAEIKNRAFEFAVLYAESETEYEWGGQDALRAIRLDCSGLVVMCYKYALVDTAYTLLFDDSTAHDMYQKYSIPTHAPQKGDLVFMGEASTDAVTHIALFEKEEAGNVYFIDATEKDSDGDGTADIDGVTRRSYPADDERIKSYGIMKITALQA